MLNRADRERICANIHNSNEASIGDLTHKSFIRTQQKEKTKQTHLHQCCLQSCEPKSSDDQCTAETQSHHQDRTKLTDKRRAQVRGSAVWDICEEPEQKEQIELRVLERFQGLLSIKSNDDQ